MCLRRSGGLKVFQPCYSETLMFAWLKPRDLMCTFTGHTVQRHPTRNLDLDTRHEPSLPSLDTLLSTPVFSSVQLCIRVRPSSCVSSQNCYNSLRRINPFDQAREIQTTHLNFRIGPVSGSSGCMMTRIYSCLLSTCIDVDVEVFIQVDFY